MIYNGKAGINRNLKILTNDEEKIKSYLIDCNYFLLRKNKKLNEWCEKTRKMGWGDTRCWTNKRCDCIIDILSTNNGVIEWLINCLNKSNERIFFSFDEMFCE